MVDHWKSLVAVGGLSVRHGDTILKRFHERGVDLLVDKLYKAGL